MPESSPPSRRHTDTPLRRPSRRGALTRLAALATAGLGTDRAFAQTSIPPTVRLMVGYPPGGSTDAIARLLALSLQDTLKTTVIVDNRPGAGGRIAASQLKNAPADGSVVMVAPNALMTLQSLVYAGRLDYSVLDDFAPVAQLAGYPMVLSVPAAAPLTTARALVAAIKADPGRASFGSSAAGGMSHFSGLMFAKAAGVAWTHVPYKGGAPLVTDLVGGHVMAGVDTLGDHIEQHRAGKLRIIGVFSPQRYALAPDIPTLAEQGLPVSCEGWTGAYAPARTPPATIALLESAFGKALGDPQLKARLNHLMVETAYLASKPFARLQAQDLQHWAPVVRESGFKPE